MLVLRVKNFNNIIIYKKNNKYTPIRAFGSAGITKFSASIKVEQFLARPLIGGQSLKASFIQQFVYFNLPKSS
jgi:hypothetical protein